MSTLPFPEGPYLWIQAGSYLLVAACVLIAWRSARPLLGLMIGAALLGYVLEYSETTHTPAPYEYTHAILGLPGKVPLGIVLGWGVIMFAAWHALERLELSWSAHALSGGLLAVILDFVSDPVFVYLDVWVWKVPTQYYGIPFVNFVGWFFIVTAYFLSLRLIRHFVPQARRSTGGIVLFSVLATLPAFLIFSVVMAAYVGLNTLELTWLPESLVFTLFLVVPATYAVLQLAKSTSAAAQNTDLWTDRLALIVPAYMTLAPYAVYLLGDMHTRYPELALILPVNLLVVAVGYSWPLMRTAS